MRDKAQRLGTGLVPLAPSGDVLRDQKNGSGFSKRGPGKTHRMEEPKLFTERDFFVCPGECFGVQFREFTPPAGKLGDGGKMLQLRFVSRTEILPGCVAEFERTVSAIDGQTFTHGLKQGLVEAVKR